MKALGYDYDLKYFIPARTHIKHCTAADIALHEVSVTTCKNAKTTYATKRNPNVDFLKLYIIVGIMCLVKIET